MTVISCTCQRATSNRPVSQSLIDIGVMHVIMHVIMIDLKFVSLATTRSPLPAGRRCNEAHATVTGPPPPQIAYMLFSLALLAHSQFSPSSMMPLPHSTTYLRQRRRHVSQHRCQRVPACASVCMRAHACVHAYGRH